MKKLIDRIDHIVFISRLETAEQNIARFKALTDVNMVRCDRPDLGFVYFIDWSAGLEIIAPMPEQTELNKALHERLRTQGEGFLAVVFGVEDLDAHKAKMEAKGFAIGELLSGHPNDPWGNRVVVRERFAPPLMDTWFLFSQIDYADDIIRLADVKEKEEARAG